MFRPFIQSLIDHGWTKKTIRNHIDNLWLLGGEIIREVNDDNEYRRFNPPEIMETIGLEGGPIAATWIPRRRCGPLTPPVGNYTNTFNQWSPKSRPYPKGRPLYPASP